MARGHTRFGNSWCREFSSPRPINDKERLVEARKAQHSDGDEVDIFFIDSQDTAAPLEDDVVGSFCGGTNLENIEKGKGSAGGLRTVWLDDRSNFPALQGSGEPREYENPLTPTGLLRALTEKQFNHEKLCDAGRRLIYISDLSPDCIHALAATAPSLHAPALRSAIFSHLESQISIGVKIPSTGCLKFELELNLPFFILRKSPPPEKTTHDTVKTKPARGWTDLSFLGLDACDSKIRSSEPDEVWCLQEAQITCVVTGTDDWRWTAYGFVDSEADGVLGELSAQDMLYDQIAGQQIQCLDATIPIRAPRDYWIKVFELRIVQVTAEYKNLTHKFKAGFDQYMKAHTISLSSRLATSQDRMTEMKEAFDWTFLMMDVLTKPLDVLSAKLEAWHAFYPKDGDGDVEYFYDDPDASATTQAIKASTSRSRSMRIIKAHFHELHRYHSELVALREECKRYTKALKLSLSLGKREAADKTEFTSIFTVNILYPVALAAAIFSMQQPAIPFPQTPRTFGITVIIFFFLVVVAQFLVIRAQPWMRRIITWWLDRNVREEANGIMPDARVRKEEEVVKGGVQETVTDEESAAPEMSRDKSRTWKSWVTRSSSKRTLVG
ncbi:hypothetical protein DL98DRAFT_599379 [Cadophora sp. DSE1049]|nr:hypothetical protein DL98DRAFT_599379 [Cadophora sp. DSE1049]